jgi:hypothetical protein
LKLAIHLAAVALAGALTASAALGEEPAPAKEPVAGKEHPVAKEPAAAKESGPGAAPIDTRIGVLPAHPAKKPDAGMEKKPSAAGVSPPGTARSAPHEAGTVMRNAIGAPVESHPAIRAGVPGPLAHGPAAATGIPRLPVAKPNPTGGSALARPGSTPQNRSGITGTGMNRAGVGPATLGGPARNTSAINGTVIKPKR